MNITERDYPRPLLLFIVLGWLLVIFANRVCSDVMLYQLQQPVLIFPQIDNTYWIFHYLRIPEILSQQPGASIFDILIFVLIGLCLFFPKTIIFPILLSVFAWTYFISFNTFAGHHYSQTGLLFILLPFIAVKTKNFNLLFEAVRYYCCFLYASSGLYKLFRGAIVNEEQMSSILMNDTLLKSYYDPNSFASEATVWLIQHTGFSQCLFIAATILELLFIIGFFTKKYDLILLTGIILFHAGNYFLLGMPFLEQGIIFLALVPKEKWIVLNTWLGNKYFPKMLGT